MKVYGALGAEGYFMETMPLSPHSPYSSSKASADHFVMAFHDTYSMPINNMVMVCRFVTGCMQKITVRPSIW